MRSTVSEDAVEIDAGDGVRRFAFRLEGGTPRLTGEAAGDGLEACELAALAEALLARFPEAEALKAEGGVARALLSAGIAVEAGGDVLVPSSHLHQLPHLWLARGTAPARPLAYGSTKGRRHPLRRPLVEGTVYERAIPWLGRTFRLEVADPRRHIGPFHAWMNDPRVDAFWQDAGDEKKHRDALAARRDDPRTEPLIGFFDETPFAYFELYWAAEDRLGEHYRAEDFDRGWHVAVGEDSLRGRDYLTAWLPSLMHYIFLDDPRTMRIVGEPDAGHAQQIRNLTRSGFAGLGHVDFPHKRSLLVMLTRERFFADRLWVPDFERAA